MTKECTKCGYYSEKNKLKFSKYICSFCAFFSPLDEEKYYDYLEEKVDHKKIETYRKQNRLSGNRQKQGMHAKAKEGKHMSRAPFGYSLKNNKLIPNEKAILVEEIYRFFQDNEISLNQLSKKYGFSVNGIKKILTNFTYLGKVKFANLTHEGNHKAILSPILFNHVQDKLERRGINKAPPQK